MTFTCIGVFLQCDLCVFIDLGGELQRSFPRMDKQLNTGVQSNNVCVCVAVRSRRTRTPAALRRIWPSRSASVSSLRGRRFPTRSRLHANSWSWRTSSTPSSRPPKTFRLPAPPLHRHGNVKVLLGNNRVERAGARFPTADRLLLFVLFCPLFFYFNHWITGPFTFFWRSYIVAIGETFMA